MKFILKSVGLILFLSVCLIDASNPTVNLKQGRLIGKRVNFEAKEFQFQKFVNAYLSIPYAEAPVGPLRFQPPVPKEWKGELNVTQHGNICLQPNVQGLSDPVFRDRSIGEDCLSLDVFVPVPTPRKAAVMLWIHGGSYAAGTGTVKGAELYSVAALGDVIIVTVNYRLGPIGFLSTGDEVVPGNMGLLDQVEAMKWVQTNIAAFGGDPDKVTIFGESAGASSVSLHTLSPLSRGLFSRAIMQSGVALSSWAINVDTENYAKRAFALGQLGGCSNDAMDSKWLLECLVNVSADMIYYAITRLPELLPDEPAFITFAPVVDGTFLPESPLTLVEKHSFNRADLMVGFNAEDGMLGVFFHFHTAVEKPHMNASLFEGLLANDDKIESIQHPLQRSALDLIYLNDLLIVNPRANYLDTYAEIATDYHYACPSDAYLRAASEAAEVGETYLYYLNHHPSVSFFNKPWTGTNHADDLVFFGNHFLPDNDINLTEEEVNMTMKMIRYWTNFAKTGNPYIASVGDQLTPTVNVTEWPRFTVHDPAYKELSPAMNNGRHLRARECRLWNDLIPKMEAARKECK